MNRAAAIRGGLCALYRRLGLERLFGGSIFLCLTLWCSAAVVLAPLLPTMAVLALAAVAFAFYPNKRWVFKSKGGNVRRELAQFLSARVLSLVMDVLLMLLFVGAWRMNDMLAKLIVQVVVIAANYFASKFWIFKRR